MCKHHGEHYSISPFSLSLAPQASTIAVASSFLLPLHLFFLFLGWVRRPIGSFRRSNLGTLPASSPTLTFAVRLCEEVGRAFAANRLIIMTPAVSQI